MIPLNQWGHYPVSAFILIATILTSLLVWQRQDLYRMFILHPYSAVRNRRYYTLFTSGLIHSDFSHLLFNMITFYFFALWVESYMGSIKFMILYLISLGASDISTVIRHRNDPEYFCLGASGAVTAVVFSSIIFNPLASIYVLVPIPIPAILYGVLYVVYSYVSSRNERSHINHSAHLWGAVCGLLLTLILKPEAYQDFFNILRTNL